MTYFAPRRVNCISQLNKIDIEDLQYVERDLCFYELVSLGFLLFGDERPNAEFVLQKLLVLSRTPGGTMNADLLRKYPSINPKNWRAHLVEALAIIGARRVLRKLGFHWEDVRQHYLPHIAELSLHVHPLLKALYKMCERLTPAQAGRLVLQLNEEHKRPNEHLRFYDFAYLEIFLLDWISRRIIAVGERDASGADVQLLLSYFKLNEMDTLKILLVDTINNNAERDLVNCNTKKDSSTSKKVTTTVPSKSNSQNDNQLRISRTCELEPHECYTVRREQAGFVLIINQKDFHQESAEEFMHLLPKKKLETRNGTDVDKERLKKVFSSFGYTPIECENLSHIDLLHYIRETVKRSFLYDSLIVCILSHGIDGAVYGANSIPVQIAEIEQIITSETLAEKPKMLIIQACQKNELLVNSSQNKSSNPTARSHLDIVKAMSTVAGFASMRHVVTGTWFIQSLCDAVEKFGNKKHILDLLVGVHADVNSKRGPQNQVMVPITSHTLRKYFFLPHLDN